MKDVQMKTVENYYWRQDQVNIEVTKMEQHILPENITKCNNNTEELQGKW